MEKTDHSISQNEIDYLQNQVYSYIQVINASASFDKEPTLNFIKENNWKIYDYGDAMSTAAPYGANNYYNQTKIIKKIADLIDEKKWPAIEIVGGTQMMMHFLWIEESKRGKNLTTRLNNAFIEIHKEILEEIDNSQHEPLLIAMENLHLAIENWLKKPR